MQTPELILTKEPEVIPVGPNLQGRSYIVLETVSVALNGFHTKVENMLLVRTNVMERNAAGLCAFCLEQYDGGCGERWDAFLCYPPEITSALSSEDFAENESRHFIICTNCRPIAVDSIVNRKGSVFMQFANDTQWYKMAHHSRLNY
jgi:hypothetical protein